MMPYSIPSDERLSEAIFIVMYRNQQVRSQAEMTELVLKEINKDGSDYRVSGERIRRLAINRGLSHISIDYNDAENRDLPEDCPVCRNPLVGISNTTLDGRETEILRKCPVCTYSVGTRMRMPGKYTFTKGRKR